MFFTPEIQKKFQIKLAEFGRAHTFFTYKEMLKRSDFEAVPEHVYVVLDDMCKSFKNADTEEGFKNFEMAMLSASSEIYGLDGVAGLVHAQWHMNWFFRECNASIFLNDKFDYYLDHAWELTDLSSPRESPVFDY